MGRPAVLHLVSLRNCLINLPLSIHGPLVERGVAPQSLVVELSFTSPSSSSSSSKKAAATSKVYVGWTGMPSSVASVAQQVRGGAPTGDRVEMDPQFAAMLGLGLAEGTQVSIELLRDLPTATSVSVTPVSADDWEILETNAEFVEMNLLSQARAVKEGMSIGCWVGGTTLVRFTVDSTSPSASPALLLTSATELIVAPKTRRSAAVPSTKTHDLSSTPSAPSTSNITSPEWSSLKRRLVRLLPLEGIVSSSAEPNSAESADTDALVSPSLHRDLKRVFPSLRINLVHHARPVARGSSSSGEAGGASGEDGAKDERRKEAEVRIKESSAVPAGHVWIGEAARAELTIAVAGQGAKPSRVHSPRSANGSVNGSQPLMAPTPAPTSLAGVEDKLDTIRSHVVNSLAARSLGEKGVPSSGLLVTGNSGAGKSSLVQQVARELEADPRTLTHTIYVDCAKFSDERLPTLKGKMKDWFDEACWHAPSLLVLDNLDRMLGAEVEHADSFPALHLAHTFLATAVPALTSRPVILLATTQSSTSLHPLLSTTHILGETVSLRGPNKTGRRDILKTLVKNKASISNLDATSLNYTTIAALTEGYLPADLRDLVDRAIHQSAIRAASTVKGLELTLDDFVSAQVGFVPLSLRDVKLQKSEVQWADIGGLHETRRILRETLEWPTKYGAIFASCPLRLRSGLLLYGFPGCGKTLLASAVAKECGLNFISVKGPEILNKYIGASEKSVRDLFERAQAAKPCILFFDEFDSIAPKRQVFALTYELQSANADFRFYHSGHDSTGVTDRVVNQMLTQMDGAEGLDGVYVLAATSRPDLIDPALLRPGRLDKSLLCDMPSYTDRLEASFLSLMRHTTTDLIMEACSRKIALAPSVDLSAYAAKTEGFSGADLQALVYNAHLDAIHESLTAHESAVAENSDDKAKGEEQDITYTAFGGTEVQAAKVLSRAEQASVNKRLELILSAMGAAKTSKSSKVQGTTPASKATTSVEPQHLQKSFSTTRPSVPAEELVRLRKIYSDFVDGRSANGLPSGEASDQVGGRESLM
ncbi:P-loop containing nucleoside triphosphate hydrolase protein [Leucosporidium creatinivorum]|uniref:Peroxisomal ATPase PEX1 n=1 Tax=Leucosporidium creatinivorum TaxID=106004 RepID=A0A1Y2FA36_9BASI|nr:P-loop containing nucleoside triphosphate hydrolase protein [Leucosporidium creatinivorum]